MSLNPSKFCCFAYNQFRLSSLVELFLMDLKTLLKSLMGILDFLHLSRMGLEMLWELPSLLIWYFLVLLLLKRPIPSWLQADKLDQRELYINLWLTLSSRGGLGRLFISQIQVDWARCLVNRIPLEAILYGNWHIHIPWEWRYHVPV